MENVVLVNDIVRVRQLDYSKVDKPKDPKELKAFDDMVGKMMGFQGKVFRVATAHNIDGVKYLVVENMDSKGVEVDGEETSIVFSEAELDVLETDWISNCCKEQLGTNFVREDFICPKCGMSIGAVLSQFAEQKQTETPTPTKA